tara:strand:- start:152 stop:1465 length:1314 start_codon:yes stop_codon:yes gene_type:complete
MVENKTQLITAIRAKSGMTIAYSNTSEGGLWKTRYSFIPSCYGWIDRIMITGRDFYNSAAIDGFIDTDLNDDGTTNTADLLLFLSNLGGEPQVQQDITSGLENSADLNSDDIVNTSDLLIFLANYGLSNQEILSLSGVQQSQLDEDFPNSDVSDTSGPPIYSDDNKSSLLWRHDDGAGFNSFYGYSIPSAIAVSFSENPSVNKIYKAVSIEGTSNISGNSIFQANSSSQPSQLNESSVGPIVERGGINYAHIGRVARQTTGDDVKLIGQLMSVTYVFGNTIQLEILPLGGGIGFGGGLNTQYDMVQMNEDGTESLLEQAGYPLLGTPDIEFTIIPTTDPDTGNILNTSTYIMEFNEDSITPEEIISLFEGNENSTYIIANSDVSINGDDPKGQYADMFISLGSNDFEVFALNVEYEAYDLDHRKQESLSTSMKKFLK